MNKKITVNAEAISEKMNNGLSLEEIVEQMEKEKERLRQANDDDHSIFNDVELYVERQ